MFRIESWFLFVGSCLYHCLHLFVESTRLLWVLFTRISYHILPILFALHFFKVLNYYLYLHCVCILLQCHQLGHMQVCTSLQTDNHV